MLHIGAAGAAHVLEVEAQLPVAKLHDSALEPVAFIGDADVEGITADGPTSAEFPTDPLHVLAPPVHVKL